VKPCSQHKQEMATIAALGERPGPILAAHLTECAVCRASLAEIQAAASDLRQASARLREPQEELHLDSWFRSVVADRASDGSHRHSGFRWVAPALCGCAVLALFTGLILKSRQPLSPDTALVPNLPAAAHGNALAPTWQSLREELHSGDRDFTRVAASAGTAPEHYRVKDAYSDVH
jgi:anti-sigma-K factor RskA